MFDVPAVRFPVVLFVPVAVLSSALPAAGADYVLLSADQQDVRLIAPDQMDRLGNYILDSEGSLVTGDLSGDGIADVVIGGASTTVSSGPADDWNSAGEVRILFGPLQRGTTDFSTAAADVTIYGGPNYDRFGWSLAIGDFNGDCLADLAAGTGGGTIDDLDNGFGAAYIFFGPFRSGTVLDPYVDYDVLIGKLFTGH